MREMVAVLVLALSSVPIFTQANIAPKSRSEMLAKADHLFGERYTPNPKGLRLFDPDEDTGPPDAVFYQYGADYVVEVVFAEDGSLARIGLSPAALLYSDDWSDVPISLELPAREMDRFVEKAGELRPLGRATALKNSCFQSGPNNYCDDLYENASLGYYTRETDGRNVLKSIEVSYLQQIRGTVESVRPVEDESDEKDVRVGTRWYRVHRVEFDKIGKVFDSLEQGELVEMRSFGCAGNEKWCQAILISDPPRR